MPHPSFRHPRALATRASLLAAAVLVALLALPPASAIAAPPTDPVVKAINAARVKRVLTAQEASALRLDWQLSARAARTAPSASRRAAVAAVRASTTRLAKRGQLSAQRIRPVLLSVRATTWVMLRGSFPSHEQEVRIPGEVAVFTYYYGRGVQFQPFETFKEGMRALNQATPDIPTARAIADRMLSLSVMQGTSRTWEYYFPFGGPDRPWTSAISQALATEFYWRVGSSVDEAERAPYLAAAEQAVSSFLRSTGAGGVGVAVGSGRYYVMYSFAPWQRILNGHLQVLINVNRYATATGSASARRVIQLGRQGVLPILPSFDTGAWSNYQPGQEAELNYHEFQAGQLVKLGLELPDPVLAEYGKRFERYLETPPTVTFPATAYPSIFPAPDGLRDTVAIPLAVDKRAKVTLVVSDANGAEVARTSVTGGRGKRSIVWDGRTAAGSRAVPGTYTGRLVATDVAGNRGYADLPAPLVVAADALPPTLKLVTMRERSGTTVVTADAFDAMSASITASIRIDGKTVATTIGKRSGRITLTTKRALADVRRGQLLLTDTSGNVLTWSLST